MLPWVYLARSCPLCHPHRSASAHVCSAVSPRRRCYYGRSRIVHSFARVLHVAAASGLCRRRRRWTGSSSVSSPSHRPTSCPSPSTACGRGQTPSCSHTSLISYETMDLQSSSQDAASVPGPWFGGGGGRRMVLTGTNAWASMSPPCRSFRALFQLASARIWRHIEPTRIIVVEVCRCGRCS